MTTVYFVRHGEVQGNTGEHQVYVGWDDKPLNERGMAQAESVAVRLQREKLAAVYTSDLKRARQTAERVAAHQSLNVVPMQELREAHYGAWEGLEVAQIEAGWPEEWKARQADPINVAPPGGESYNDVWRRWEPALQELIERHAGETIAIVAHNGALRVMLCHLLDMPLRHFRRFTLSNCGLGCMEIESAPGVERNIRIVALNETCHLRVDEERRKAANIAS
jgi:broad specificity phosphatase PhoE